VNEDNQITDTGITITSVLQDYKRMGEEAVKAANHMADGPVQQFVPHRLVNL
jgi:DNA-binding LacI/PurR family transcriptional regulator